MADAIERNDKTLLGEFGFAALAGLFAFFSAVLTTVFEGHSAWRPFGLIICTIKARHAGFHDCIDPEDMFAELFDSFRSRRMISPL